VNEIPRTVGPAADSGASFRFEHGADRKRLLMRHGPALARAGARLP
jgi:hypothetical protein